MNDVMTTLRDRRAKAENKVQRATKVLELAKKELSDLLAAERVMADITGESGEMQSTAAAPSDRDRDILLLLPVIQTKALSPAELHTDYVEATRNDINLDTFRTALWRLKGKVIEFNGKAWQVWSDGGRYWREGQAEEPFELHGMDVEEECDD